MSVSSLNSVKDATRSWTDDLPVCHLSGVGFSTNQVYREDGNRREQHEFEDTSVHFKSPVENTYLYGVFDGHDGSKVSKFASQRLPAELLLDPLKDNVNDEQVKQILTEAFESVDKHYFESIDDALAEKAKLQLHVPEGMSYSDASKQYPALMQELSAKEKDIKGGTMAAVALIVNNRLFVANVGCSRALLCRTDEEGQLRLSQLTVDHNLSNEAELKRLHELGLDVERIRKEGKLGSIGYTRTIGDHYEKREYTDLEILQRAASSPVIVSPEIYGGVEIDQSCSFLILMSDGLYKTLENATGTDHVNADIAGMVATEFSQQATLNGVAQAVVDKVVRKHHDAFMMNPHNTSCQTRDDITLLVRNFNYPLAMPSPQSPPQHTLASQISNGRAPLPPLSLIIPSSLSPNRPQPQLQITVAASRFTTSLPVQTNIQSSVRLEETGELENTMTSKSTMPVTTMSVSTLSSTNTNDSTQSSDELSKSGRYTLSLDENNCLEAYVKFDALFEALDNLSSEERSVLEAELEPRPDFETIQEEKEPGESEPSTPVC